MSMPPVSGAPRALVARHDPSLHARMTSATPLFYTEGPDAAEDRPPHVRSASGIARWGGGLVIVQDDANFLAVVEVAPRGDRGDRGGPLAPRGGARPGARPSPGEGRVDGPKPSAAPPGPRIERVSAVPLPRGPGGCRLFDDGRGNKADKLDLEACAVLPPGSDRLVVFGSGSSPARERLVLARPGGEVEVRHTPALYAHLRTTTAFAGSELNVEGALAVGGALRLFQRGNGAPRGALLPVNATGDLDLEAFLAWLDDGGPLPTLKRVTRYALGALDGVRCSFTDAAPLPDGRVAFLACAEDSPDAVADGEVRGCLLGVIDGDDVRTTPVLEGPDPGRRTLLKLEALLFVDDPPTRAWVASDEDDPEAPARLCELHVTGL